MKKNISKRSSKELHDYKIALQDLEHKVENMFQRLWKNPFNHESQPDLFSQNSLMYIPKMDIVDRKKEVIVKVELPGIDKKDLDISIANHRLVIKAKTCHEEKEETGDYFKQEISKNEVYRAVSLPAGIDDESNVKTSFKNGVLELSIPKEKKSHRKKIEVE
jgi:HSP20 family protein